MSLIKLTLKDADLARIALAVAAKVTDRADLRNQYEELSEILAAGIRKIKIRQEPGKGQV